MPPSKATTPSTPPAGADASKAAAQTPTDLVRVYNRSTRRFDYEVYKENADGYDARLYSLAPQAFTTIPRFVADKLVGMYKEDILPGDEALRTIDANQARHLEDQAKIDTLEQEKAALAAELEEARKQLSGGQ